jgi:hypothetical protein
MQRIPIAELHGGRLPVEEVVSFSRVASSTQYKFHLQLARKGSGFRTVRNMSNPVCGEAQTPACMEVIILVSALAFYCFVYVVEVF